MTDAEILSCGLPLHDKTPTSSTLPVDGPEMTIKLRDSHRLFFKFTLPAEGEGFTLKGMPEGAKLIELVWDFADVSQDPAAMRFHEMALKSTLTVQFNNADEGKRIALFARYISTTGEKGPWSEIRFFIIP